jgi:hypothetical protein
MIFNVNVNKLQLYTIIYHQIDNCEKLINQNDIKLKWLMNFFLTQMINESLKKKHWIKLTSPFDRCIYMWDAWEKSIQWEITLPLPFLYP